MSRSVDSLQSEKRASARVAMTWGASAPAASRRRALSRLAGIVLFAPAIMGCATTGRAGAQQGAAQPSVVVQGTPRVPGAVGDVDWILGTPETLLVGVRRSTYPSIDEARRDERLIARACEAWSQHCELVPEADTTDASILVWVSSGTLAAPTRGETVLARTGRGQVVNAGIIIDRHYGALPDSAATQAMSDTSTTLGRGTPFQFTEQASLFSSPQLPLPLFLAPPAPPRASELPLPRADWLRYRVIAHELGHAMGLRHSDDAHTLMAPAPSVFEVTLADRQRLELHVDRQQREAPPVDPVP